MNFDIFTGSRFVTDLGLTLLHSFWQIGLVALGLFIALQILRNFSTQVRYLLSVTALAASLLLPVITFVQIASRPTVSESTSANATRTLRQSETDQASALESAAVNAAAAAGNETLTPRGLFAGIGNWLDRNVADFAPIAVGLWLLGVAFFSLRLGGGFSQLRRFRTKHATEVDAVWQDVFSRLCVRVKVSQTVRILQSALVETPIAIGVFRPVVLIPAGLFLQIHPRELETIIAHELIHIRRYDPLVNVAQCVVETLLFYHPAAWWMSSQIRP
jgi:beta-lactamase regulating signal transducer with metallopeptidase domain